MYLLILFFLAPADRWMDDNWSKDQEKTPEDNYLVKNQPFLEILKELHSLVFEFVGVFKLNSFRLISKNLPSFKQFLCD